MNRKTHDTAAKSYDALYQQAVRCLEQGNLNHALNCFRQLDPKTVNPDIAYCIRLCLEKLARKFWRQAKVQELAKVASELKNSELDLACARLEGTAALKKVADAKQGWISTLATCAMQHDLKIALLMLRQIPEQKSIAEGWLALWKKDAGRAMLSFTERIEMQHTQACVGMGVTHLCLGETQKAQTYLTPLKSFAPHHFPLLAKCMKWDTSQPIDYSQLQFYLFKSSLSELQQIEKQLSPDQQYVNGWINLRIGDYLIMQGGNNQISAHSYWLKAEKRCPILKLDVLKRLYLAAYDGESDDDFFRAFFEFYRELRRRFPAEACGFIEHIVFDGKRSVHYNLVHNSLLSKSHKWLITPPPTELQLLWLHLIYHNELCDLNDIIVFEKTSISSLVGIEWQEWSQLFASLDMKYSKQEKYLYYKFIVVKLLDRSHLIREIIVQLLHLNAHLKEQLLPIYTKEALRVLLDKSNNNIELKAEIRDEVSKLLTLFPASFDLARLSILSDDSSLNYPQRLDKFIVHLSAPMLAVLQLQIGIDQGLSVARCKALIPAEIHYNVNFEADWRLFSALSTPRIKFPQTKLYKLLERLADNTEKKHRFFNQMHHYENPIPPLFIIEKWLKQESCDWRPTYHKVLYCKYTHDENTGRRALYHIRSLIRNDIPEFGPIMKTLNYYALSFIDLLKLV